MAAKFVDFYRLLGLEPFAHLDEVKAAWRRLAKRHHPDRNPGDADSARRFNKYSSAYRTLSDPRLRGLYDEVYARRMRRGRDTSRDPFQRRAGRESGKYGGRAAETGTTGVGSRRDSRSRKDAGARREVPRVGRSVHRRIKLPLKRFQSGGLLRLNLDHLDSPVEVRLPERVLPDEVLVLPGLGIPGSGGGAPGRLILELRPDLPEGCELKGSDLLVRRPVDAIRAGTGCRLSVTHPDGRLLEIRVPPGSGVDTRIRLRGQGLPARRGMGDLVCRLDIVVPPILDSRARRLAERLLRALGI